MSAAAYILPSGMGGHALSPQNTSQQAPKLMHFISTQGTGKPLTKGQEQHLFLKDRTVRARRALWQDIYAEDCSALYESLL